MLFSSLMQCNYILTLTSISMISPKTCLIFSTIVRLKNNFASACVFETSRFFIFRIIHEKSLKRQKMQKKPCIQGCCWTRSSHRRCSINKAVFKNSAIFTGKHLCWSIFLIKQIIKIRLQHRDFPGNIAKFLRTPVLKNIYKQLLLLYQISGLLLLFFKF